MIKRNPRTNLPSAEGVREHVVKAQKLYQDVSLLGIPLHDSGELGRAAEQHLNQAAHEIAEAGRLMEQLAEHLARVEGEHG